MGGGVRAFPPGHSPPLQAATFSFFSASLCLVPKGHCNSYLLSLLSFSLSLFFLLMWTIFKVFIEFVTTLFLFYALAFPPLRYVGS